MNKSLQRILVVDDSETDLHTIISCLKDKYQVLAAKNGDGALQILEKTKIDVMLLDVNMPGIDGYEVCRRIREDNQLIQIIFISANDGIDEILKGYDVGGNDYITKPFLPDVLVNKIQKSIEAVSQFERLQTEKNDSFSALMTAIASMGDLGGVINFLRSSFPIKNSESLAALFLEVLTSYELSGCIQLRSRFETRNYSNRGEVTPLETELLSRIAQMTDRFAENGRRMLVNFPYVSLLIKNMPIDDEMKMGRLRDTLAILIESTNEKQISIEKDNALLEILEANSKQNQELFKETEKGLEYINTVHNELRTASLTLVDTTADAILATFINLGLTEQQETRLTEMLHSSQAKAQQLYEESIEFETQLSNILRRLKPQNPDSL